MKCGCLHVVHFEDLSKTRSAIGQSKAGTLTYIMEGNLLCFEEPSSRSCNAA